MSCALLESAWLWKTSCERVNGERTFIQRTFFKIHHLFISTDRQVMDKFVYPMKVSGALPGEPEPKKLAYEPMGTSFVDDLQHFDHIVSL